jgi:hypothetical protein
MSRATGLASGGARLDRTRGTPLRLGSETNGSALTGSEPKSEGIKVGRILVAKLRCKQHDRQHLSRLVPSGRLESLPGFASTLHCATLGTR